MQLGQLNECEIWRERKYNLKCNVTYQLNRIR
uniref:Uncharacterized protein n=1 Tax=Arundo donax TaxID=35708 RepID=A0A0A9BGM4_ARUDO